MMPRDKLSTSVFWKTEADADLALTGLYNYLYQSGGGYATSCMRSLPGIISVMILTASTNYGGGQSALSSGITPQSGDFVLNYYANSYKAIAAANSFLANVEKYSRATSSPVTKERPTFSGLSIISGWRSCMAIPFFPRKILSRWTIPLSKQSLPGPKC